MFHSLLRAAFVAVLFSTAYADESTVSNPPASAGSFNPAVSLILSGIYTHLSQDPTDFRITGFPLPADAEVGPGERGFSLAESELGISANIDHYFYGAINVSIAPDDSIAAEEAFIQTLALSDGFGLKFGRFFSGIGYQNSQHAHVWDFADAPLVYQAFLGAQYGDDGIQVTWLAPTNQFLQIGVEAGRGSAFPGGERNRNGAGATAIFVHVGDDLGISHSWRAGLSLLKTSPEAREFSDRDLFGNDALNSFSGDGRVMIADLVWKYAPNGNSTYTNFKLQTEYMRRHDSGDVTYDADGALASTNTDTYDAKQSGWYVQGVYQFMPYWRVGVRTERLDHGTVDYASNNVNLARSDFNPSKNSVMVDFSPSEFSRMRLQYSRDDSREDVTDTQWFLQYQMSLGAHGAHQF